LVALGFDGQESLVAPTADTYRAVVLQAQVALLDAHFAGGQGFVALVPNEELALDFDIIDAAHGEGR